MGKRNAAKRMKTASEVNTSAWFEETGRVRGPRLQAIEGGRAWHPDDADQKQYKRAATAPEGDRGQRYQKNVKPRSENQARLMEAMDEHALVAALGPAGTGKTYLAICKAVEALQKGKVSRIILSRPAVEAGEQIGFLPGAMEDKLAPYLRPLYDALSDRLSPGQLKHMLAEGVIEIAPIGFMRGRTLNNAFIVIDEAQNCTYTQLKMLLTRLGWHSTMVITGDPAQSDLLPEFSGLANAAERLEKLAGAAVVKLEGQDVVRHPLVADMLGVL
ncbi:PhoH family protein [uncultured Hyphomonas sp.]|uniref:PhoH family protein n=1 Tax=uncultured Hyphomonas sp. TaxID=225298 RepID=UPI002AAC12F3|nr:PhoH family protein [uncultured Hyphomonas sp.]